MSGEHEWIDSSVCSFCRNCDAVRRWWVAFVGGIELYVHPRRASRQWRSMAARRLCLSRRPCSRVFAR